MPGKKPLADDSGVFEVGVRVDPHHAALLALHSGQHAHAHITRSRQDDGKLSRGDRRLHKRP
jgi:hypothetical protein